MASPALLSSACNLAEDPSTADSSSTSDPCSEEGQRDQSGCAQGSQGGQGQGGPVEAIPSEEDLGISENSLGCSDRNHSVNVRVNQDCTFRRQTNPDIAFSPVDPENLIVSANDLRLGWDQSGIAWSTNNGRNFGDMTPPFRRKLNDPEAQEPTEEDPNRHTLLGALGDPGTGQTYDLAADGSVAFDSQGRAFFGASAFDAAPEIFASMIFVTSSPLGAKGSFFLNIPEDSRDFIVAEDNSSAAFHAAPSIAADRYPSSDGRDNVYVTWVVVDATCGESREEYCESPVYGSMSTNHGRTWSTPELISGRNAELCAAGDTFTGDPDDTDACNFDDGPDIEVMPNGDVVVVFNNTNAEGNNAQQLAVTCHPTGESTNGTASLNCGAPTKIGDDVTEGRPLCLIEGSLDVCIPGPFIFAPDYPRIGVNTDNGELFVVWQDYRNGEFDIQMSSSTDGGATWTPSQTVNPDTGLDHYFPSVDVAEVPGGSRVGVSYYRSERVPDENVCGAGLTSGIFAPCENGAPPAGATGCAGVQQANSDYVLAGGSDLSTPYDFRVVSPVFPPPDGIQAGFRGPHSGLVINQGTEAHPVWSDTRNADPYAPLNGVEHDDDVFTDGLQLPNGTGNQGPGTIGSE
ncbi:hypothetical protein [Sorangium sp. So ce128]|uniref:hypothetical protein n=1 Tax=Sorangium sp. So ce128 TaxID=3133281 RepID=UPI003F640DFD